MISRKSLLLLLLALVLVAGGVLAFRALFEPVTVTETLPPQGEARYNPLYALKLALDQAHQPVRAYPVLNPAGIDLGEHDTLVLYTRPEAITGVQVRRLEDWVRRGGHLLMPGPAALAEPGPLESAFGLKAVLDVVDEDEDEDEDEQDDAAKPGLLDARRDCTRLAQQAAPVSKPKTEAKTDEDEAVASAPGRGVVQFCGARFTSELEGFQMRGGDSLRGFRFGRLALGRGTVTVLGDLAFLSNGQLQRDIAGELAYQALAPGLGQGTVHLVYAADVPSLARLLMLHAWRVLLPALLALAAWLWWRSQRFGPRVPAAAPRRRALLEHVQAAGEFAFRRGRMLALHSAVLELFLRRLALRDPVLAALDGETLVHALATRFDLAPDSVRQALRPVGLQRPDTFLHSLSTLVLMRNRL